MKKYIVICLAVLIIACVLFAATDEQTATVTRQTDNRKNVNYPVWDAVVTVSWDDDDIGIAAQDVIINGTIQKIIFVTPNGASSSRTYQLLIKDNEGATIFDSGERDYDGTYVFSVHEPVTGTINVSVDPSGALGTINPDGTVTLRGI
jgi:hypothetical protein